MKRSTILGFDLALLFAILLLLSPRMTGLRVHEWLGIALCAGIVLHLVLAWPWISSVSAKLSAASARVRVNFSINLLLFVLVMMEIVSGLAISQVALPALGRITVNDGVWRAVHNLSLNLMELLLCLHVAMNWRWIVAAFGNSTRERLGGVRTFLVRSALVLASGAAVAEVMFAVIGKPTPLRLYPQNEIARFHPTFGHGALQFGGKSALLAFLIYAGRRWIRVRL